MKYNILIIILLFVKINMAFCGNYILTKESKDSCKIIKLDKLPLEVSKVFIEFYKFLNIDINSITKCIMFVDYKKINDSTNIYIVTQTDYLHELLENIPSFYFTNDRWIICIYTGNENPDGFDYNCIEPLLKTLEKYSKEKIETISKENLIFRIKSDLSYHNFDPFIVKFILCKGEIIFRDHVKTFPTRLFKENALNKIKIIK